MKTPRLSTFIATGLLALVPAAGASAHHSGDAEPAEEVPASVERTLGGEVEIANKGLYRVELDGGGSLLTHGPDTAAEVEATPGASTNLGAGGPERAPVCTSSADNAQHVLYGHPAGTQSNLAAVREDLRAQIRRNNWLLNRESRSSGEPELTARDARFGIRDPDLGTIDFGPTADYRVRCDANQQIVIDEFTANGASYQEIADAAKAAGFTNARTDYTIFYDGVDPSGLACGTGNIREDDDLAADNLNQTVAGYGVTWRNCWYGDTSMHENGHNQGAVQPPAPHSTGTGWHCWDEADVMCYSPDGGSKHQQGTESICTDRTHFDCGNDDYFDADPEAGEYLATHWNLGSTLNAYIAFGVPGGEIPTARFTQTCVETACQFTDASSDDAAVLERAWSFGYGPGSSQANPAHTFPGPGAYQVALQARDGRNQWGSVTQTVNVTEEVEPLTSATPFADTIGAKDSLSRYSIRVPRNTKRLRVVVDGPTCAFLSGPCEPDLGLYLKRAADPTRTDFDARSQVQGADEKVRVRNPGRGQWRIGVDNVYAQPGTAYSIKAIVTG